VCAAGAGPARDLPSSTSSQPTHPVAQIEAEVGYESEAAFNRAFKREFGTPPVHFRTHSRSVGKNLYAKPAPYPTCAPTVPQKSSNFFQSAAYCFMDAKRNSVQEPHLRSGETRQSEGFDLESVIERAQSHDAEALGEIYRRFVRRVFGLCRYMLDSRDSAEDATSEIFLKVQRSIESYDGSIPFPGWLLRLASNQCIDVLRRRARGRKVMAESGAGAEVIDAASSEPSPLGALISKEERAKVRDTVARLPENYRVPLVLRYYSELSYDEIAHELGLEKNYVGALIFRAKQELRRRLAPVSR